MKRQMIASIGLLRKCNTDWIIIALDCQLIALRIKSYIEQGFFRDLPGVFFFST